MTLRLPDRFAYTFFGGERPADSYLGMSVFQGSGEFKEYCFAVIMLFYVLSIYRRSRRRPEVAGEGPTG